MPAIRPQKARLIGQLGAFMRHCDPFAPVALGPDTLREGPQLFCLPIPTPAGAFAQTLRLELASLPGHFLNPSPFLLPYHLARTLDCTRPMLALALKPARQLPRAPSILNRRVGLPKLSLSFSYRHHRDADFRAFLVGEVVFQGLE
jgi:hypothetical protein